MDATSTALQTRKLALAALIFSFVWSPGTLAVNTACASNQLSWYTDVVGETPCATYQRLRQICNPDYQVPQFRNPQVATPGDFCDDQVSSCCCNTVAFQLSMLCLNCQYDTVDGNIGSGIDTDVGSYAEYRLNCGGGKNHSLPDDIQQAVCNKNIRLDNFLYGGWDDGSWFYVWSKENAQRDHSANDDNTFTHCPNQISQTTTQTPSSPTPTSVTPPTSDITTTSKQTATSTNSPDTTTTTDSTSTSTSPASNGTSSTTHSPSQNSTTPLIVQPTGSPQETSSGQLAQGTESVSSASSSNDHPTDSDSDHKLVTNLGAIVGGVVGGVGAIVLLTAGYVFWRIRYDDRARRAQHGTLPGSRHFPAPNSPQMSQAAFNAPSNLATRSTSPDTNGAPPTSPSGDTALPASFGTPSPSSAGHHMDSPTSPGRSTFFGTLPSTFSPIEELPRHADAGPVVQLVRSPSGRLPPAYRSWDQSVRANAGSVQSHESE
ncbi:hypothetical protein C8Q80DRAFT_1181274 [Daedaleopsis nitida]|nr:hypothetical protein C8Q80DRAFT_1181274 [Daedaleopsis nitida]